MRAFIHVCRAVGRFAGVSAVLDRHGVSIALWGARNPEQFDPLDEILGWSLDADAKLRIDQILRECVTDPVGPEFMAPGTRTPVHAA